MGKHRKWDAVTKAKIALIAFKGEQTYNEIASIHGVHPKMIQEWKKQLLNGASALFINKSSKPDRKHDEMTACLRRENEEINKKRVRRLFRSANAKNAICSITDVKKANANQ